MLLHGAGASYGARLKPGPPNGPPPPRGAELAGYMLRWLKGNHPTRRPRTDPSFGQHYIGSPRCANWSGDELWQAEHLGEVTKALIDVAHIEEKTQGKRAEATPFEVLMGEWTQAGDGYRLFGPAHRLLAYSMNYGYHCAFVECRDLLDSLPRRGASESLPRLPRVGLDRLRHRCRDTAGLGRGRPGASGGD